MKCQGWENEDVVNLLNDSWIRNKKNKHRPMMYQLVQKHYKPGMSILDAGCGTGVDCHDLLKISKLYTGADTSVAMLKKAIENEPGIKFILADITNNFYKDEFDIVFCNDVIRHVPYWKKSVENIIKLAKVAVILSVNLAVCETRKLKGDVCGIEFPDKAYNVDEFKKFIEDLGHECNIYLGYDFTDANRFASKYVVEVVKCV